MIEKYLEHFPVGFSWETRGYEHTIVDVWMEDGELVRFGHKAIPYRFMRHRIKRVPNALWTEGEEIIHRHLSTKKIIKMLKGVNVTVREDYLTLLTEYGGEHFDEELFVI